MASEHGPAVKGLLLKSLSRALTLVAISRSKACLCGQPHTLQQCPYTVCRTATPCCHVIADSRGGLQKHDQIHHHSSTLSCTEAVSWVGDGSSRHWVLQALAEKDAREARVKGITASVSAQLVVSHTS